MPSRIMNLRTPRVIALRRCHPPLTLEPRIVTRQGALFLSPRRIGGGTRGACDEQGGALEQGGTGKPAEATCNRDRLRQGTPSSPSGHLPHCVVESVGELLSHLHPDPEHRQHVESQQRHETPPVDSSTNRESRLREGRETPGTACIHPIFRIRASTYPLVLSAPCGTRYSVVPPWRMPHSPEGEDEESSLPVTCHLSPVTRTRSAP